MRLSVIAAVAENGVIGRDNDLPWRLPADLKRFKRTTVGHHLLMGRRTFESIGRPLPGRTTVVISRGRPELPDGVRLAASLEEAIEIAAAADDDEAFVAGGAEIFREALGRADRLYLTRVEAEVEGDRFFPELDEGAWRLISSDRRDADERNAYPLDFRILERATERTTVTHRNLTE